MIKIERNNVFLDKNFEQTTFHPLISIILLLFLLYCTVYI